MCNVFVYKLKNVFSYLEKRLFDRYIKSFSF